LQHCAQHRQMPPEWQVVRWAQYNWCPWRWQVTSRFLWSDSM
jgi:hypothetical protein